MITRNEVAVFTKLVENNSPFVYEVELNDEVIGYTSENRDWNKDNKPISLVTVDGQHVADFCCIAHAVTYLVEKKTGISFDEIEMMNNSERRSLKVASGFLDALLYALEAEMKGKRPH